MITTSLTDSSLLVNILEATCEPLSLTGKRPILTASYDPPSLLGRSKESLNGRYASNTSVTFSCNNSNNLRGAPFVLNAGSSKVHCRNGKWNTYQLPDCGNICSCSDALYYILRKRKGTNCFMIIEKYFSGDL